MPNGTTSWQYAAARSHYHEVELRHRDQVVWTAPMVIALETASAAQMPLANDPYFTFFPPQPLPAPEELR
jgi:hypothetical protein